VRERKKEGEIVPRRGIIRPIVITYVEKNYKYFEIDDVYTQGCLISILFH